MILRLSSSRPRPLAAVPALLRLVVVPCLNAHKRHVRDPPPFPITLPELGSTQEGAVRKDDPSTARNIFQPERGINRPSASYSSRLKMVFPSARIELRASLKNEPSAITSGSTCS